VRRGRGREFRRARLSGLVALLTVSAFAGESPFATTVLEYSPAPGQFVNSPEFDDPTVALGRPRGGGTNAPDNESIVTLGGFGGFLVLGFDHRVMDDPRNAFGMDAIVYGNAHWVGNDPQRRWAEAVTMEISLDVNENGLADDPWYLIPGSHITDLDGQFGEATWDDDTKDVRYPPADGSWIPQGSAESGLRRGMPYPPACSPLP